MLPRNRVDGPKLLFIIQKLLFAEDAPGDLIIDLARSEGRLNEVSY